MGKGFRRIVTAHDEQGRSVVRSDEVLRTRRIASDDADFALVWTTPKVPVDNNDDSDGGAREAGLTLHGGSVIRIVDLLPGKCSPMHRSYSLDYGILLAGALEMELDGGEVVRLNPGDIVVQRGTNHLWRNPSSDTPCRIAFVLIEAAPVRIGDRVLAESN